MAAAMSNNFSCGVNKLDSCSCKGAKDCRDMRRSGMCSGPMVCNAKGCSCLVVGVARGKPQPGSGISGVTGGRPSSLGTKLQSPAAPVLKVRPQRPLLPILKK
jgi:hypothetical protein